MVLNNLLVTKIVRKSNTLMLPICFPYASNVSKMSAYRRDYHETKCISFLMKNGEFLQKHKEVWDKFSNSFKKRFDCDPVYNEKSMKTKFYEGKINTYFQVTKVPKVGFQYLCLLCIGKFCFCI